MPLTTGVWHAVCLSWDDSGVDLLCDNTNVYHSTSGISGAPFPENKFFLGATSTSAHYNQKIKSVMVIPRKITGDEFSAYAANGTVPENAVAVLAADEGAGMVLHDSVSTNTATLNSESLWTISEQITASAPTNMLLTVTNSLLTFVPGYALASALVHSGTNTLYPNNCALWVSRDAGTTWSAAPVSLTDTWDISNKLASASITLTNQPEGSNVLVRVGITNSPPLITVRGLCAPCSP